MKRKLRIFFSANSGGAGAGSGQGDQSASGNISDGNGNQQQQQQQQPADPFAGVDMDLLDETTRNAITTARTTMQQTAAEAAKARDFQSRYDKTAAQLQLLQNQLNQQQQQQQKAEPTLLDEIEAEYMASGATAEQAKQAAKLMGGVLGKFGNRFGNQINQHLAPITQTVLSQSAVSAFSDVASKDSRLQIPEVAQATYERVVQMAQQGMDITPEVISSMGKIFYVDHLEKTGNQQQQQQQQFIPQFNMNQPPNGNQQSTRFTYPGAGHMPRQIIPQSRSSALDADTAAAIAATTIGWQAWGVNAPTNKGGIITRGGVR